MTQALLWVVGPTRTCSTSVRSAFASSWPFAAALDAAAARVHTCRAETRTRACDAPIFWRREEITTFTRNEGLPLRVVTLAVLRLSSDLPHDVLGPVHLSGAARMISFGRKVASGILGACKRHSPAIAARQRLCQCAESGA